MGTLLGVIFIVAAAVIGVYVGTRPTTMDGRWIAEKLKQGAKDEQLGLECDRAIPVGVKGARFRCVQSGLGASQELWFRMNRDGKVEADPSRTPGARPAPAEAEAGEPEDAEDAAGGDDG